MLFTSESVSPGHPDKVCDQISDSVLDAYLRQDPLSRVAVETAVKGNSVWVFGEVTSKGDVDVSDVVHNVMERIGYDNPRWGMSLDELDIRTSITHQSPNIASGVDQDDRLGAGDQGLMFGYAFGYPNYSNSGGFQPLMPPAIWYAHRILERYLEVRRKNLDLLGPDAKSQVTIDRLGPIVDVDTVVLSAQHAQGRLEMVRELLMEEVVKPIVGSPRKSYINPAGDFVIGGPVADAGLTGRKIIVDTYGGAGRHGGGAFSGKDPTKVDRSAAYAARWLARNVLEHVQSVCDPDHAPSEAEVQLAYAIGVAEPVNVSVFLNGGDMTDDRFVNPFMERLPIDFSPKSIIDYFDLRRPIYTETATFGHFGREGFPWERSLRS